MTNICCAASRARQASSSSAQKAIGGVPGSTGEHRPAQDVVVEGEVRAGDAAQHRLADGVAIVQVLGVGGLERQPGDLDDLHQHAVARRDR